MVWEELKAQVDSFPLTARSRATAARQITFAPLCFVSFSRNSSSDRQGKQTEHGLRDRGISSADCNAQN